MRNEKGFSLIELLIVVAIIGIIAAIAVPNLVQSKGAANEASAIMSVRNITTAQITYASTVGSGNYAGDLATLIEAGLIDNTFADGIKDGYTFATAAGGANGFTVTAVPDPGPGKRGFYSDQTAVIRYTTDGSAPDENSTPLGDAAGGGGGGGAI